MIVFRILKWRFEEAKDGRKIPDKRTVFCFVIRRA